MRHGENYVFYSANAQKVNINYAKEKQIMHHS